MPKRLAFPQEVALLGIEPIIGKNKQVSLRSVALSCKQNQVNTHAATSKILVLYIRTSTFAAAEKSCNVLSKELTDRPSRKSSLNDSIKSSETLLGLAA